MRIRLAAAAVVLAVGCADRASVRVDVSRGEPASALSFQVSELSSGDPVPVEMIRVTSVASRPKGTTTVSHWIVARPSGARAMSLPTRLRYGETPSGYAVIKHHEPLWAGSYAVIVKAGHVESRSSFVIGPTGIVE